MELAILNFGSKVVVRLNTTIDKNSEKCTKFFKRMCSTHNKFQVSAYTQDHDFPARDQHLENLQERLQAGEEIIATIECISEESIRIWIVRAYVHKHLFEELLELIKSKGDRIPTVQT